MRGDGGLGWLIALFAGLFVVFSLISVGCSKLPNEATGARYLDNLGYSNIRYTGRSPFAELRGCSDTDVAVLHYSATNAAGRSVKVDVCQGWPLGGAHMRGQ